MGDVTLQIPIPESVDKALLQCLDRDAREAVAVRLYKAGKLSHGQFADYLQIDRARAEEVLRRHDVEACGPSAAAEMDALAVASAKLAGQVWPAEDFSDWPEGE